MRPATLVLSTRHLLCALGSVELHNSALEKKLKLNSLLNNIGETKTNNQGMSIPRIFIIPRISNIHR